MASVTIHPHPVLQILASSPSSDLVVGLERALQKLGIGFTQHSSQFLLERDLELFERKKIKEKKGGLAIHPAKLGPAPSGP